MLDGRRAPRMLPWFRLDTRPGGGIMAATMVRHDTEHQRGQSTQWTGNLGKQPFDRKVNPMKTTLRKLTVAWPLVIFLLLPPLTRAETAVQAWVQRYNGPGNEAYAVAVDGSNNVIVTGYSYGSGSSDDYAIIKYSSAGVPLWTNLYNGPGNGGDFAYAVAVDTSNNVIVTGYSDGGGYNHDYATIKYSSEGVPLWTNRYNGLGNSDDYAQAVAVDGNGDVIVTGYSTGSGDDLDYATIKYSGAGEPLWTNCYNGPGNGADYAFAVAVDGSNNVIVTGGSDAGSYPNNYSDYATIQYSSAGVPLWTNRYGNGPGNDSWAATVAVDGSNNVIVTGTSCNGVDHDYATIQYSSAGVPLWTNRYHEPGNYINCASAVAVDGSHNVIVTGYSSNGTNSDYVTIKYSSAGVPLWTNRYNGSGNGDAEARAVAVDGSNNVIVTGRSEASASSYIYDYATIKYSSAGVPLWTNLYNGPGNGDDQACALALDHSGNVIVTGYSTGSGGDYDFATVKYICVPSPVLTGLQLTNGTFQMRVDEVLQSGTLVIEACTDLVGWAPLFTNLTPTNVLFYTDPDAGNTPTRFYRAFQFP